MSPRIPRLPVFTAVAVALAGWVVGAAEAPPHSAATAERLTVRGTDGLRTLEGEVLVEAVDGGVLLKLPDERYEVVQPAAIVSREPLDEASGIDTPRDLGQRILADLPPGFSVHVTKHYVVCFDTSRDYAKWCAALFERLHDAFGNFWTKAGLEVVDPPRPLVVVIFADRAAYEAHAVRDLGAAADRVVGYYNLLSNRVTTFDLTGTDGVMRPGGSQRGAAASQIMASPAAAGLVSTLVHEATHQMAFNCGMHRRLAPVPLWLSEGIATYFETPELDSDRGWRGIGAINRPRLDHFLANHRPGDIAAILASDDRFRSAEDPLDAYAAAWALTRYLIDTRKRAFVDYVRLQAAKQPLTDDSPEERLRDFETAFGASPAEVEADVVKAMARLASRPAR
jgi:hypothetical protein